MIFIDFSKTNKYKILLLLLLTFSLSILLFGCADNQFYTLDVEITPDEDKGEVIIEGEQNHYNQNDTVKLKIETKDEKWNFHKWQGDLDSFNYEEEIVIQENTNIIANFSDDLVELQVSPENDFEDLKANGNGGEINGEEVEKMSIKGDFNDNQVGDLKYNLDWNEEENKWIGRYDLNNSDLSREDDFRYDVNNGGNDLPKEGKLNIGEEDVLNKGNGDLKQVTFDFDNWIETVKEGEKGEILEDDIETIALIGEFNDWEKDNLDYALDYRDDYLWQEELDLEEGEEFRFSFNEGEYILPSIEDEQELNTGHEDNLKIGDEDNRGNTNEKDDNGDSEQNLKKILFDFDDWDEVSENDKCGEILGKDIENITLKGDFNNWDAQNSDYPLKCLEGEGTWEGEFDLGDEEEFRYSINDGEFILPKNDNGDDNDEDDTLKIGDEKEKEYIEFKCNNLEELVYETLDKDRSENIYPEDVEHILNLDYSSEGIEHIKALQYFESLRNLNLNFNDIQDVSYLEELYDLESLYLNRNKIDKLDSLSGLTNLRNLYAHQNNIEDISFVNNLSQLEYLSLWGNEIKDISHLSNLNNIEKLNLQNNNIREIKSLKTLDNLEKLEIHRNNLNKAKLEFFLSDLSESVFDIEDEKIKTKNIEEISIKGDFNDWDYNDEDFKMKWDEDNDFWFVNYDSQNISKTDEFNFSINQGEKTLPQDESLVLSEESENFYHDSGRLHFYFEDWAEVSYEEEKSKKGKLNKEKVETISIKGDFNDWDRFENELELSPCQKNKGKWNGEFYLQTDNNILDGNFKQENNLKVKNDFNFNLNHGRVIYPKEKSLSLKEENILDNNIFIDNKENIKELKDRGVKVSY